MNPAELKGSLEAIIYAAEDPATLDQLARATETEKEEVRAALDEMIAACAVDDRGVELRRVARGYRFSTKPQYHEVVRKFIKSLRPPVRLSMPALETLAVIAYKQPVTLPEVQEIRGVNCSGVIQTLLEKRLVATAGRKAVIGRPILYRTTREFLVRFGLNDVDELPSLKEFEQLAREALGPDEGIEVVPEAEEGAPSAEAAEAGETAAADRAEASIEPETAAPGDDARAEAVETGEETAGTELAVSGPGATALESEAAEAEAAEPPATVAPPVADAADATEPEEPQPEPNPEREPETVPEPELPEPEPSPEPEPVAAQPEPQTAPPAPESQPSENPSAEEEKPGERSSAP